MAKWINMSVIAEGVETKEQADFLKSIGCPFVQGYLYAKPMPLEEYEALAARSVKQRETPVLETVENLDSNAFWNPESMDTLIFNSYLGGACIIEYSEGNIELLRANDKYVRVIGSTGMSLEDALKLDWAKHMEEESRVALSDSLQKAAGTGEEFTAELVFLNLPGCAEKTYLRSMMRVIAKVGARYLIYSTNENITAQRLAEQKRLEAAEQLSFLENVAHELLTQPDVNAGVYALLDRILAYFGGNRCYIFEFDYGTSVTNNTYELCAEGVTAEKSFLQGIPLSKISFWLHAFDHQDYVEIGNVDALDVSRQEKELLQAQNIQSLLAVPLRRNRVLTGFIGVDDPRQRQKQIESLSALGDYAAVLLKRRDMEDEISYENSEKLSVMDGIPGGFVRMGVRPNGKVAALYHSAGFQRLVHMNTEELMSLYGENAMAGVHPDDIPIVQRAQDQMLRQGEVHNVLYRLQRGGGGYVWVMIFGKMQKNPSGEVYLNVYYTDASEQRKQEDVQIELLDNLPCGAALYEICADTLSIVHLNRHYWELVGRPPRSCEEIQLFDTVYPDDRSILFQEIAASIRQKRDPVCDIRIRYGEAGYRRFHMAGRIFPNTNGKLSMCATYTPISDQTQNMQAILPVILSAIMESTSDYSFIKDKGFRYLCGSNAFAKMAGGDSAQSLVGKTDYDLFSRETADKYRRDDEAIFEKGSSIIDCIEQIPSPDDVSHFSRTSKYPIKDSQGNIIGLYGVGRDITEEQAMTEKLRISEEEYQLAMQHTGSTICRFTIADKTLALSPNVAKARGLPERVGDMPAGMLRLGVIPKESERNYIDYYDRILRGDKTGSLVFQCRMENGLRWLEEHFSTVFSGGKPLFAVISYSDITDRQQKELVYKKWQQSLRNKNPDDYTLFCCNISKDASTDTQEGNLLQIHFNAGERTFNQRTVEYAERFVFDADRPEYIARLNSDALLAGYYRGIRNKSAEYRENIPSGGVRWLRLTIELVEYPNSSDVEAYLMYENIDDVKKAELLIRTHAETDPLTGLLNRTTFAERTNRLLASRKHGTLCALLMLDLDGFKQLNDRYGHIAGDKALVEVAQKLRTMLRAEDLVGRLGGDEFFACLYDMPNRRVIERRAELFRTRMRACFGPDIRLTACIGLSVCPEDGDNFEVLYRKADAALYHAKRIGNDHLSFYSEGMNVKDTLD